MLKRSLIATLILTLFLTACSATKSANPAMDLATGEMPAAAPQEAAGVESFSRDSNYTDSSVANADTIDRLVIRNADLSIVVVKPDESLDAIIKMANEMGGYVVDSRLYQRSLSSGVEVMEASVTIRVPAEKLDAAMQEIKAQVEDPATDVLSENVTGQDVTKEYTNLQSRLRNSQAASDQLTEIMASATKPEDVLNIFNQLKQVNEEIEVIKGEIKYYEESAAMSAITVQIQAQETIAPVTIGTWKPEGVARDAVQALIEAYQWIANAAIWAAIFCLPIALPVGLVLFFIFRAIQRSRRKKKASVAVSKTESETPTTRE